MKLGAFDFINKPPEPERLLISIQNALRLSRLEKEVSRLKRQEDGAFVFEQLIGHETGLQEVVRTGRKAAAADIPVMLLGETGVGKEVFARALHGESSRVGKPFVAVNCGAIPAQLVESTLFGHEKGAFTGAIAKAIGKFREAEGGTIFLDEIGELPLDAQVKLLRALQQKEISPVGADHTVPINVRVISATNLDLERQVAEGKFRDDLYFRLNVLPIRLPSLRDRKRDIPELVQHFLERFAALESRPLKTISDDAMKLLESWPWPGNIRELENAIHRAVILADKEVLEPQDFTSATAEGTKPQKSPVIVSGMPQLELTSGGVFKTFDQLEKEILLQALQQSGQNVTRAAQSLGLAKSTFYRKLKDL
jgi:DNA-binding NtrC family response regulator